MTTAPTRSPNPETTGRSRPGVHPGGLWLRPPAAVTVGPVCPVRPRLVEPSDDPWARLLAHFAEEPAEEAPAITLTKSDLPGGVPWADRRLADRLPVRPGSRTEVRRWGAPADPDMAVELVNVSEVGVGVRLWTAVGRGARLDVTLWGPGAGWCGRGLGLVCWSVIGENGECLAGLRLSRRLTARALRELVAAPRPARPRGPGVR